MFRTLLSGLTVVCFAAGFASAQVVNVTVNGVAQAPVASGEPIDVTVATTGVTTVRLLGSTADTDIGRVRVHGATDGRVDILIGTVLINPDLAFPPNPNEVLSPTGRH